MFHLEAVCAQRLYRLIAERIAEKIRAGGFPVGSRLPAERELAELLQVSRSSVREALIALELWFAPCAQGASSLSVLTQIHETRH